LSYGPAPQKAPDTAAPDKTSFVLYKGHNMSYRVKYVLSWFYPQGDGEPAGWSGRAWWCLKDHEANPPLDKRGCPENHRAEAYGDRDFPSLFPPRVGKNRSIDRGCPVRAEHQPVMELQRMDG